MIELHGAHGYLLSSFLTPLSNQRDGRIRRLAREPAALPAGGVRGHARRLAEAQADERAHLGHRLDRRRHHRRGVRRHRPGLRRRRRRPDRRLGRPDLDRGAAGLRPHVPDPVQRPHPQRGRACAPWRSATSSRPTTSIPSSPPAAPTCACWPVRTWPIRTGPCAPRPNWAMAASGRRCSTAPATTNSRATSARQQQMGAGMSQPLDGKHALVTGAGSGIGAAAAKWLAAARLSGHPAGPAHGAAERTSPTRSARPPSLRPPTSPTPARWRPPSGPAASASAAIDILVNNAGVARRRPFLKTDRRGLVGHASPLNLVAPSSTTTQAGPARACWSRAGAASSTWPRSRA